MNSTQAKKIKIIDYLNVDSDKNEFFIKSPFNQDEKTASFKINQSKNIWYDHAQGLGGNILDLVMLLNSCNLAGALKLLESSDFSFSQAKKQIVNNTFSSDKNIYHQEKPIIKNIKELNNIALLNYLEGRKINLEVAKKYLKEVYYSQNNKNFFSLAFKNDSEGYETRNPYFKGCLGSKDITTIKGMDNPKLNIFEGFMDFLSALTYYKLTSFKSDVIILNSVSNKTKIDNLLYSDLYNKIFLFLDNDKAGNEAKQHFFNLNKKCIDCSKIYQNSKDFNEFLITKKI